MLRSLSLVPLGAQSGDHGRVVPSCVPNVVCAAMLNVWYARAVVVAFAASRMVEEYDPNLNDGGPDRRKLRRSVSWSLVLSYPRVSTGWRMLWFGDPIGFVIMGLVVVHAACSFVRVCGEWGDAGRTHCPAWIAAMTAVSKVTGFAISGCPRCNHVVRSE